MPGSKCRQGILHGLQNSNRLAFVEYVLEPRRRGCLTIPTQMRPHLREAWWCLARRQGRPSQSRGRALQRCSRCRGRWRSRAPATTRRHSMMAPAQPEFMSVSCLLQQQGSPPDAARDARTAVCILRGANPWSCALRAAPGAAHKLVERMQRPCATPIGDVGHDQGGEPGWWAPNAANEVDRDAAPFAELRSHLVHCVDAGCSAADRREARATARLMVSTDLSVTVCLTGCRCMTSEQLPAEQSVCKFERV